MGVATEISETEIYGAALERAYDLEHCAAKYPRIVIGEELWRYLVRGLAEYESDTTRKGFGMRGLFQNAMNLITEDEDGKRILDYMGPNFASVSSEDQRNILVRRAYQFVVAQHAQFLSAGNTKLGPRYTLLRQYFETRLGLWGLTAVA